MEDAIAFLPAAPEKTVLHHTLGKEQKEKYQNNYKQKFSNFDGERRPIRRFLFVHDDKTQTLRS
jgi:hypothetical protein